MAKGVNSREQLAAVISLNCDEAQGTITGHPARATEVKFELCMFDADSSIPGPEDQHALGAHR